MVRRRLGWPSADTFVSDIEIVDMLLESRRELFDFMVSVHQGMYRISTATFDTVAGQSNYTIQFDPNGTLADIIGAPIERIIRISAQFDDVSIPLRPWQAPTAIQRIGAVQWQAGMDLRYSLTTGGIAFGEMFDRVLRVYPTPSNVVTVDLMFNTGPVGTTSVSTTGIINDLENDEYLVLDCMIKCLQMEETDPAAAMAQKERLIQRLTNEATPLDAGQPQTIQDARGFWDDSDIRRWR